MHSIKKCLIVFLWLGLSPITSQAAAEEFSNSSQPELMSFDEFNRVSDQLIPEMVYTRQNFDSHPGFYDRYLDICREFIGKLQIAQQHANYLFNRGRSKEANTVLYKTIKEITFDITEYPSVPPHSMDAMIQTWKILDNLNKTLGLNLEGASMAVGVPVNGSQPSSRRSRGYTLTNRRVSADDLNQKLNRPNSSVGGPSQGDKAFFNISIDLIELVGWAYDNLDQDYYTTWYDNCGPRWNCRGNDLSMGYVYYDYVNHLALEILESVHSHIDKLNTYPTLLISSTAFSSAADLLSKYEYAHYLQCFIADLDYFSRWTKAMAGKILIVDQGKKYYHPSWELSPFEKRAITSGLLESSIYTLEDQVTEGNPICWNHHWRIRPPYEGFYSSRRAPAEHSSKKTVKKTVKKTEKVVEKETTVEVEKTGRHGRDTKFPVYEIKSRKH